MPDLPPIVQSYIHASNAHDVESIVSCFSADAVVRDDNATHRGKIDIKRWITTTIEKYKFQFKPLSAEERENKGYRRRANLRNLSRKPGHARLPLHHRQRKNRLADYRFLKRGSVREFCFCSSVKAANDGEEE